MADDKITPIITAKTVGLDQLATFDASGQAGPGVTLEIALAEVKRLHIMKRELKIYAGIVSLFLGFALAVNGYPISIGFVILGLWLL